MGYIRAQDKYAALFPIQPSQDIGVEVHQLASMWDVDEPDDLDRWLADIDPG